MTRHSGRLAALTAAAAALGVIGLALVIARPSQTRPGGDLALLTHHQSDVTSGGKLTGVAGRVVQDKGCIFLASGQLRWLVYWPQGTTLDERVQPVAVIGRDGRRVVGMGEAFSMTGAAYRSDEIDVALPLLDGAIPESCLGSDLLLAEPGVAALRPIAARWRVDPVYSPTVAAMTLHVLLRESDCAAGFAPYERLQPALVDYLEDSVAIKLLVLSVGGGCRNPEYPLTVDLAEPIGNRALVDGSSGAVRWFPGEGIVQPTPDLGIIECEALEIGPFAEGDSTQVTLDRDLGVAIIDIHRADGTGLRLPVRYTDSACMAHPVLGPIIEQAVAGESPR